MFHADNAYYYPACRILTRRMRTNTVSNTAFRGFGGPQGMLFAERMMDHIAYVTRARPARRAQGQFLRRRRPRPHALRHAGRGQHPAASWSASWSGPATTARGAKAIAEFNATSPVLKKGIALTPVKFGISFTLIHLNQAGALVHVYRDGSISLNHGGTEMGQGLFVKVAQVVAEEFGVGLDRVKITATSTAKVPNTSPTAASAGTDLNAQAALVACRADQGAALRLHRGEVERHRATGSSSATARCSSATAPCRSASWRTAAYVGARAAVLDRLLQDAEDPLGPREGDRPAVLLFRLWRGVLARWPIDTMTGEMRVDRVDILHDVGKSLNPAIDIGQIEGGFVQGMGWLTTEELVWDSAGRLLHPCALDLQDPDRVRRAGRFPRRAVRVGRQPRGRRSTAPRRWASRR